MRNIQLGCGLHSFGRIWGVDQKRAISGSEAQLFLQHAVKQYITFFDTAPTYGASEERLGNFLKTLSPVERAKLTIATKVGEVWDEILHCYIVDHSYKTMKQSLDTSVKRLGQIDILQLNKSNTDVLKSEDWIRLMAYARKFNISHFGASIGDVRTGKIVLNDIKYEYIQLPFNEDNVSLYEIVEQAKKNGKKLMINRPFQQGKIFSSYEYILPVQSAFQCILQKNFDGVILSGTSNISHLDENILAFNQALKG